jgi:predicted PurR-regulated permease PerM
MQKVEHTLSWPAIGRILLTILIILFIWKTLPILILILISAMFATALYPLVMKLHTKLPLLLSTLLIVLLLLVPFIILGASVIPTFVTQFPQLLETLDTIITKSPALPPQIRNIDFNQYIENAGNYVLQSTTLITSVFASALTLFFLTFYLIYDAERLLALGLSIFPKDKQKRLALLLKTLGQVTGQYIRGNLLISVICGGVIFIGLTILQIPFAAPLAIFVALMDLLPLIGLTIGMIPAIIIALSISPVTALIVAALYLIYQQIESSILAPLIYNKTLNLSPALGFLAVIIGVALYGIVGAFLALPIAASLPAIIKYIREDLEDNTEEKEVTKKRLRAYKKLSK